MYSGTCQGTLETTESVHISVRCCVHKHDVWNVSCLLRCPHSTVPCLLRCPHSTVPCLLRCPHSTVPCLLRCPHSTVPCLLRCPHSTVPCLLRCPHSTVPCLLRCPHSTVPCSMVLSCPLSVEALNIISEAADHSNDRIKELVCCCYHIIEGYIAQLKHIV